MDKPQVKAIKDFIGEAEEILESLSEDVESAQQQFEAHSKIRPDVVNKIFREMHSLKGLASMLALEKITVVSHDMESLLDKVRMGKIKFNPQIFEVISESRRMLRQLVVEVGQGGEKSSTEEILQKISVASGAQPKPKDTSKPKLKLEEETLKSFTEYEEHRLKENLEEGSNIFAVQVGYDFTDFDTRLRALTEALNEKGEVISTLPVMDPTLPDGIHFRLIFGTTLDEAQVSAISGVSEGKVSNILEGAETKAADAPAAREEKKAEPKAEPDTQEPKEDGAAVSDEADDIRGISNTVKVDILKLDEVMGLVGELGLVRASFRKIADSLLGMEEMEDTRRELLRHLRSMEKKLEELQRSIIEIRMVPIGQIFTRLNRTGRRLARQSGKEVSIQMFGGETELDKRIMDELVTPLVHIIRNAIDHGLEPTPDRLKAGKSTEGSLAISAYHRGNSIIVEVTDDGKGLDYEKIRKVAVERGVVGESIFLSPEECLDLIFQPGFSSADKVTEVSGRGVGLDAVKTSVESLKGSISVWTEKGKGCTFQIILPITLAIIQSLIVKCCDQFFAMPISSIVESFRINVDDLEFVDQKEVYNLRGLTLPIMRLESRFGLQREGGENPDSLFVVVAKRGDKVAGIIVDELQGEQETVIHPIGQKLGHIPGIAGATEIGENQVILVIDTAGLLAPTETVRV
jgi:two-component system, chemotaxis family, sensor kinase CheA